MIMFLFWIAMGFCTMIEIMCVVMFLQAVAEDNKRRGNMPDYSVMETAAPDPRIHLYHKCQPMSRKECARLVRESETWKLQRANYSRKIIVTCGVTEVKK